MRMISAKDIEHLAELARIEVGEGEAKTLARDVEAILKYVEQVRDVSAGNGAAEKGGIVNVFREDANPHESGIFTDVLLTAAPDKKNGYMKVKKIL